MSDGPRLSVAIRHRIGGLALDVAFELNAPWTVLFAPSGAGKSTVLRVIAGLIRPDAGAVRLGASLVLTDTAAGVFVPAHKRAIRFVAQEPALFPHLSVEGNVAYGMREEQGAGLAEVMALCRIQHLAGKMPARLSGGERQRVALARALGATGCRAMLLDEPFSGLDAPLRDDLMRDVRAWLLHKNIPVLHVTHDVGEVFAAEAEVISMERGQVLAQGPASMVLQDERARLLQALGHGER